MGSKVKEKKEVPGNGKTGVEARLEKLEEGQAVIIAGLSTMLDSTGIGNRAMRERAAEGPEQSDMWAYLHEKPGGRAGTLVNGPGCERTAVSVGLPCAKENQVDHLHNRITSLNDFIRGPIIDRIINLENILGA